MEFTRILPFFFLMKYQTLKPFTLISYPFDVPRHRLISRNRVSVVNLKKKKPMDSPAIEGTIMQRVSPKIEMIHE